MNIDKKQSIRPTIINSALNVLRGSKQGLTVEEWKKLDEVFDSNPEYGALKKFFDEGRKIIPKECASYSAIPGAAEMAEKYGEKTKNGHTRNF